MKLTPMIATMNRLRVLSLFLLATLVPAQSLPEGYDAAVESLPANAGNVLALAPGQTVWFDGTDLVLRGLGQQRSLLTFQTPVFGSFTLRAGPGRILFGESSTGGIWLVPVNGAPPSQPLATLAFNYDAVLWNPQTAIVSAKTSGFGNPDNELFTLDLQSGATSMLARLPGASGPVAVGASGDLWYATSSLVFPTPAGQTDVLRFRRQVVNQAIASQQVLGLGQARTVLAGLDSASDLAFDDDGDLFFVDWFNSTIGEIDDAAGPSPVAKTLVDHSTATFSGAGLQFVSSGPGGAFEPFQPTARTLRVHETSFGTLSQVRSVVPRTAALGASVPSPVPAGPFALQVAGGPANGSGLIAIGLPAGPGLTPVAVPGFEQPLLWHQALIQPVNTHFLGFDATGSASLPLVNPGFGPLQGILAQAAFLDAASATIGATAPRTVVLGP